MTKSVVSIIGCILKVVYRLFIGGKCPGCKKDEVKNEAVQNEK